MERKTLRERYEIREREGVITQDKKRHQPPETVPFIVHITTLFTLHFMSRHGFLLKSIPSY